MSPFIYISVLCMISTSIHPKEVLILDLSNTLLYFSKHEIAKKAPCKLDFARYCFQTRQSFTAGFNTLELKAYQALETIGSQPIGNPDKPRACDKTMPYPQFFCDMMMGLYPEKEGLKRALSSVDVADKNGLFVSDLEKNLVKEVIKIMFSSQFLIRCCKPQKDLIDYIHNLSQIKNAHGKPRYQLYVLSNMQKEVVDAMTTHAPLKKLFEAIPLDHWIVSAEVHLMKPHRDIFDYLLSTFNLNPDACVFVDDQPENIEMAHKLGIHGILFTSNFSEIKPRLNRYFGL